MQITAQVTCFAPGDAERTQIVTADVPVPGQGSLRDWASEHVVDLDPMLFSDQNGLRVVVTACADRPELINHQFDWRW